MTSNFVKRVQLLNVVGMLREDLSLDEAQQRESTEGVLQYFTSARDCDLVLDEKLTYSDLRVSAETALENVGEVYRFVEQNGMNREDVNALLNNYITRIRMMDKATSEQRRELSEILWNYRQSIPNTKLDLRD